MKVFAPALALLSALYTCQLPGFSQLRESYSEQERARDSTAARIQDAVNMICKHGQFIAPAFGASDARNIYLVDQKRRVFRYTDDATSGVWYSDGYSDSALSNKLTCNQYRGLFLSAPYAWIGKVGSSLPCEDKDLLCEYSIEGLGLYVYQKPRNGSSIAKVFLANHREKIEVGDTGTYRRCDGYFGSAAELRYCFGK